MINRYEAERAVTQLLCLTMGQQASRDSNHLANNLPERIQHCRASVQAELRKAADAPNMEAAVSAVQRKLNSLQSLETLSTLICEVEW